MTIEQNLLFVNKDKELANKLLSMCELNSMSDRLPSHLSGGQKQRVALCRAMMRKPKLLLLDEPLSALDVDMRAKLQDELQNIHNQFGTTTILVSHDPSEIYKLSNRVIVLNQGKIIDDGTPQKILLHTKGSQKFSLRGEILDILKADIIYIATDEDREGEAIGWHIAHAIKKDPLELPRIVFHEITKTAIKELIFIISVTGRRLNISVLTF